MSSSLVRSAIVLGILAAVGPLSIDMYLPALPQIERDLSAGVGATQMTLTVYLVTFGIAQLIYGPWADQVGRKPPLYVGIGIFVLGSLGCIFAPDITVLIVARGVQAAGAAVMMVVPRAVIRDMHTGTMATRLMALIMLVISVSPMLAPLLGSGLILLGGWRLIFVVLCAAALISLLVTAFVLPETLKPENRVPVRVDSILRGCRILLGDRGFMMMTFVGGFGMASFFVFIASASFVYTGEFGLTPTGFSIAFAVNAIGFFGASQTAASLGERYGMMRVVLVAATGFALCTAVLLLLVLGVGASLPLLVGGLFLTNACLGLVIPTTMVMALEEHGEIAGLAASLGGTLQMVAGGLMIAVTSRFFDGTATAMVAAIAFCGAISLVLALLNARPRA